MTTSDELGSAASAPERIDELEAKLARATAGLRDLDHRIKNDLQLIASVFTMQIRRLPPGLQREAVRDALARLSAVTAVHRRLNPLYDRLDAAALVRDLVGEAASELGREDIHIAFDVAPVEIPTRQAAAFALIVGELVRNALAHAFPGRSGVVTVDLDASAGEVRLTVRDDGVGLLGGAGSTSGFGTTLVGLLTQQLRGAFEIAEAKPGVSAMVRFPQTG